MPKFKKNPTPIMKKQAYGEPKSPFTLRSGNGSSAFKNIYKGGGSYKTPGSKKSKKII